MQFNVNHFQQFFGIITANLYLARLEQELEVICEAKIIRCLNVYERFLDDGIGMFVGGKKEFIL